MINIKDLSLKVQKDLKKTNSDKERVLVVEKTVNELSSNYQSFLSGYPPELKKELDSVKKPAQFKTVTKYFFIIRGQ